MSSNQPSVTFTHLVEPTASVTQNPPPAPFDAQMAYLLGQCCSLTYTQFDAGLDWTPDFSGLTLPAYSAISASNAHTFSVYEANEPGPTTGDVGDYDLVTAGFGVQLQLTPSGGGAAQDIIVIALRGSRTFDEWMNNADAFPTSFAYNSGDLTSLGSVHAGFYGLYTIGTNGQALNEQGQPVDNLLDPQVSHRAVGSIAYQVGAYVGSLSDNLPIYVTGHSLGGALATLCALDIAYNFAKHFSELYMYSLASPRIAVSLTDSFGIPIPYLDDGELFLANYQTYVPNSYRIVHASDIVPILPPLSFALGPLSLTCAHVTDQYQITDTGAAATAHIQNDAVSSIDVTNEGFGYTYTDTFPVSLSGGGGTGAIAQAYVDGWDELAVNVIYGGVNYTSAPAVSFPSSGSLAQNVVNFCAQTGDIGGNHSCTNTYVPYLAQLAAGFD